MPHFLVKRRFASFWRINRGLKYVLLFLINNYRDIRLIALQLLFGSWRISRAPPSLKYVLLFSINKYRDIWKPAPHFLVKRRFASFWRISRGLKYVLLFSINKYCDIRLIALLRKLSCFLEASRTSWSTADLNMSVFSINKYIGTSGCLLCSGY